MTSSNPTHHRLGSQSIDMLSVGEFFQQINWYGSVLLTSDDAAIIPPYETVGQFFGTFPWQGTTAPTPSDDWAPVGDDDSVLIKDDTLTLEDLSALF